jgi:uncharacterized membrane protein YdbT with pleckstrin-like domain
MNGETPLWKGSPSQWLNLGPFVFALLVAIGIVVAGFFFWLIWAALLLPLAYAVWRFLHVRSNVFELTSERLRVTRGVINQNIDEIELYRVKDSFMVRPWWMRITGLASIVMETSDRSMRNLTIPAIRGGVELRELLRKNVEIVRDRKRVREMDFDEINGDALS